MPEAIEPPGQRVPITIWLPAAEIGPSAMDQVRATADHPEATANVAVMPDCHVGFGITIGPVFPTPEAIVPEAVGVDIGCGMCAVRTDLRFEGKRAKGTSWRDWADRVRERVPTGFATQSSRQQWEGLRTPLRARGLQSIANEKAALQLGTLGGGNIF